MIFKVSIAVLVAVLLLYVKPWSFITSSRSGRTIHDPMNIFCGPNSCYEVLGIERSATPGDVKKVRSYLFAFEVTYLHLIKYIVTYSFILTSLTILPICL
jgi:hypothetical protein